MKCVFSFSIVREFFAKKLLHLFAVKLTMFVCTNFDDVLKFFETEKS